MATFFVSRNNEWVLLDILETLEADGTYVNLIGDTLSGAVDVAGHRVMNAAYSGAGSVSTLVAANDVATVQYIDDLVTVTRTEGAPITPPLRNGQVWMVVAEPPVPPPPPISPSGRPTSPTVNTLTWTDVYGTDQTIDMSPF